MKTSIKWIVIVLGNIIFLIIANMQMFGRGGWNETAFAYGNHDFFTQLSLATSDIDRFNVRMILFLTGLLGFNVPFFMKNWIMELGVNGVDWNITPKKLISIGSMLIAFVFLKKAFFPILGILIVVSGVYLAIFQRKEFSGNAK